MGSYNCPFSCFCQLFYFWYLVQIINFLLIELPTILFAVWSETIGCIYFICPGCAEHVLANEVVLKTLREQTEQCAGCTTFWGGAEGIKMAEPTLFLDIEFVYTLFIFLKLRNTKEMRRFNDHDHNGPKWMNKLHVVH
jgi:hypothetical protein